MGINNLIYLSEIIFLIVVLIIGIFVFKAKNKKGIGTFIGITIYTFFLIFGATFILEKPEMKMADIVDLEITAKERMKIPNNEEYIEPVFEAVDEFDGDITDKVIVTKEEIDEKGVIYLTFDDGPSTNVTPIILDILKEKNVEATFFILNYDEEKEEIVRREYNEGHTIGIHGYSHDYSIIYESEEAYMENLTKLQEKIKDSTGYTPTITRFPGGSSNTISKFNKGIMTRLTKLVVENGFKYFDWNVCSEDAVGAKTADKMYENVIKGLSKSKTNVVLMHDFGKNEGITEALPRIIDYGIENGYVFEKITEDTPMITHRVFN